MADPNLSAEFARLHTAHVQVGTRRLEKSLMRSAVIAAVVSGLVLSLPAYLVVGVVIWRLLKGTL